MADHSHHDEAPKPVTLQHADDDRRITYFAATHTRGKREMFGIRAVDRGKHIYVIGKTGMGKSTMLENMAIQDIQNGEGIAFIDPHGSTAEKLLDFVPQDRIKDVVYFAPFDTDYPMGFNVMEDVGYEKRHLVVSGLMGAFKRIWVDAWSARMEYILQNTLLALLEYPGATLIDVNRMLTNKAFREAVIEKVTDPIVRAFWVEEFAGFSDRYTQEATPAIQNKIGAFVSNPLIRNIIGQPQSSFDLRKIMDDKKIFIVNLSKGRMGETNASLLGSMLTVKIYLAAMSRADEPASRMAKLPRFYFYVDEFQSMMNEAFADILSESRKYKLALTLANQYIEQMEEKVRDAVFGNVGTLLCFRVGPFDAEVLKTVFEPTFMAEDLVGLGLGQIYLTLMIDGVGSPPFSAETIPPIEAPTITYRNDVVTSSRAAYGRIRADVEAAINRKQSEFVMPPKEKKDRKDGLRSSNGWNAAPQGGTSPREKFAATAQESQNPRGTLQQKIQEIQREAPPAREPRQILPPHPRPEPSPVANHPHPQPGTHVRPHNRPIGQLHPQAVRPPQHQQPRPRHDDVVSKREAEENAHKNALREAIEKARAELSGSQKQSEPVTPARSPLDLIREKNAAKQAQKPHTHQPQHNRQHGDTREHKGHSDSPPRQSQQQAHEQPQPESEPRSEQKEERERSHERLVNDHRLAEVSHRELVRVLNGKDRDADDL